jgi:acetate kinase
MALVFVVNSGSSSVKYRLVDPAGGEVRLSGQVERIGVPGSGVADHDAAMSLILDELGRVDGPGGTAAVDAVGHRVVQGGDRFRETVLIDDEVERAVDELAPLAPLHNPANLAGIRAARAALPDVPHAAVFDTAFHATLPPEAYTYALPRDVDAVRAVRRYGFHGTSVRYVSARAAELLGRPLDELRLVVLHLGNGASATAVDRGRSIDTSMGLTPLAGLVMGSRSGDLDPGALLYLLRNGLDVDRLDELLNRRSGLLGLSGHSDVRDVLAAAGGTGDPSGEDGGDGDSDGDGDDARLALDVMTHRIRHYVGAYAAQLGGLDAIVFTGGVGENAAEVRSRALTGLGFLGVEVDAARNSSPSREARAVSPEGGRVAVLVVPTDEELEIARQTAAVAGI